MKLSTICTHCADNFECFAAWIWDRLVKLPITAVGVPAKEKPTEICLQGLYLAFEFLLTRKNKCNTGHRKGRERAKLSRHGHKKNTNSEGVSPRHNSIVATAHPAFSCPTVASVAFCDAFTASSRRSSSGGRSMGQDGPSSGLGREREHVPRSFLAAPLAAW